jgi:hypothetical protein
MTENRIGQGHDFEYDEAHDAVAAPTDTTPVPHRVDAPRLDLDPGGDYGYDEAHDFGG